MCLHRQGFRDIFKAVKEAEDKTALQLLPQVSILSQDGCAIVHVAQQHGMIVLLQHCWLCVFPSRCWMRVCMQRVTDITVQPALVQDGQTPVYCKDSPTVLLADCNDVVLVMMHHMLYCWLFRLLVRSMTQLLQACAIGPIGLQDCIILFACYCQQAVCSDADTPVGCFFCTGAAAD